ncbi:hypothetical protein BGZ76_002028 [Entomortierella beljakovae]|nr:hypothetical protein BGZ76_002028 [Entomortierella beljakovae]
MASNNTNNPLISMSFSHTPRQSYYSSGQQQQQQQQQQQHQHQHPEQHQQQYHPSQYPGYHPIKHEDHSVKPESREHPTTPYSLYQVHPQQPRSFEARPTVAPISPSNSSPAPSFSSSPSASASTNSAQMEVDEQHTYYTPSSPQHGAFPANVPTKVNPGITTVLPSPSRSVSPANSDATETNSSVGRSRSSSPTSAVAMDTTITSYPQYTVYPPNFASILERPPATIPAHANAAYPANIISLPVVQIPGTEPPKHQFQCSIAKCKKSYTTHQGLRRHIRDHKDPSLGERFPCLVPGCTVSLRTKQSQKAHIRLCKQKLAGKLHLCPEIGCEAAYGSTENLSRHRLKHQRGLVGVKYPCSWPKCTKILATTKSLKDHLQIHAEKDAGIKLYCPVDGCGKVFNTNRCLRAHELRCMQVKSGAKLPCPFPGCDATFGSTDYVRRHVLDHEKGLIGVEFKCDFADCKAILANPLTLQRHKQLHEEQSLGFEWKCLIEGCSKVYSGSKQLSDHQTRIHKDLGVNFRFDCPYSTCERGFECQRTAYKHECLYRTKQCPFEDCICLLPSQSALEAHVFMHNTLKTRPPYPCFEEGCSKVFDTKEGILAHALTHLVVSE